MVSLKIFEINFRIIQTQDRIIQKPKTTGLIIAHNIQYYKKVYHSIGYEIVYNSVYYSVSNMIHRYIYRIMQSSIAWYIQIYAYKNKFLC